MDLIRKAKRAFKKEHKKPVGDSVLLVRYNQFNETTDNLTENTNSMPSLADGEVMAPLNIDLKLPKPPPRALPRRRNVINDENRVQPQLAFRHRKLSNEENMEPQKEKTQRDNIIKKAFVEKPKANEIGIKDNILKENFKVAPKPKQRNQEDPANWPVQQKIEWFDKS